MISTVIIVLREVLEAVLVICVLLASARAMRISRRWLIAGAALGLTGALSYAFFLARTTQLFGGFGQEIINATLLIAIALALATFSLLAWWFLQSGKIYAGPWLVYSLLIISVTCSMTREGAEILIYIHAYANAVGDMSNVLSGAAIGAGIGMSLGTFIYYALVSVAPARRILIAFTIASLMAAGMMSQACLYLIQADLLPSQLPLWDSSFLISESSLHGELLHAMLGYEASPTGIQLSIYAGSLVLMITAMMAVYYLSGRQMLRPRPDAAP